MGDFFLSADMVFGLARMLCAAWSATWELVFDVLQMSLTCELWVRMCVGGCRCLLKIKWPGSLNVSDSIEGDGDTVRLTSRRRRRRRRRSMRKSSRSNRVCTYKVHCTLLQSLLSSTRFGAVYGREEEEEAEEEEEVFTRENRRRRWWWCLLGFKV